MTEIKITIRKDDYTGTIYLNPRLSVKDYLLLEDHEEWFLRELAIFLKEKCKEYEEKQ